MFANESVSNLQLGYFLFRTTLGVNFFFHGFIRIITGLSAWEMGQAAAFVDNPILPMWAVHLFLYTEHFPFLSTHQ